MSNCFYDNQTNRTRCGEFEGIAAYAVSANSRVTCRECWDTLTPDEREGDWYGRTD